MLDSIGREIDYARISVTDRCNLRCVYCMPAEGVAKRRHEDILSFDEILRACRCFAGLGITKIKVTGGEPLVRRGVVDLIAGMESISGIKSVTLTTNGVLLGEAAAGLRRAGLDGVNVSLDTLDADAYRELTRGGDARAALAGLDAALEAGIPSVKVNCVPMAGFDADDAAAMAGLARERPVHVRFIELMPMGMGAGFSALGREELRAAIEKAYGRLTRNGERLGNGPAEYYSLPGFAGRIGFIDTLDHTICSRCNRIRLTAEGALKTCLHMDAGTSLKPALAQASDDALHEAVENAIRGKPRHHEFSDGAAKSDRRGMSQIGG